MTTMQDILDRGDFVTPRSPIRAFLTTDIKLIVNWNEASDLPTTHFTVSMGDDTFVFETGAFDATHLDGVSKGVQGVEFEYSHQVMIVTGDFQSVSIVEPFEFQTIFGYDGNALPSMGDLEAVETYIAHYRAVYEMVFGQVPSSEKLADVLRRWCDLRNIPRDIFNTPPNALTGDEQA